jgi:hypothetical protein
MEFIALTARVDHYQVQLNEKEKLFLGFQANTGVKDADYLRLTNALTEAKSLKNQIEELTARCEHYRVCLQANEFPSLVQWSRSHC